MLYCHIPDLQAQLPNSCQYPGSNCASHVQHHNNHEMLYCFVSLLTVSLVSWRDLILSQRKEYSPRRNYLWFQTQYWFPEGSSLFPEGNIWTARSWTWNILQCCAAQITRPSWLSFTHISASGKAFFLKTLFTPLRYLKTHCTHCLNAVPEHGSKIGQKPREICSLIMKIRARSATRTLSI